MTGCTLVFPLYYSERFNHILGLNIVYFNITEIYPCNNDGNKLTLCDGKLCFESDKALTAAVYEITL